MGFLKKLLFAGLSILSFASPLYASEQEFMSFLKEHNKHYDSLEEYRERYNIFTQNVDFMHQHNSQNHTFTLSLNEYADLTHHEFRKLKVGRHHHHHHHNHTEEHPQLKTTLFPSSLDWRDASQNPKNIVAVTPIKNQEQCGSCWSFSAIGATEGAWAISGNELTSFSEQQLVDCSSSFGNNGCNGGEMDDAFQYIIKNGICTETDYPYQGVDGQCNSACSPVGKLNGFHDIPDESHIYTEIQSGPVSVAIEADQPVFQFYSGGVLDNIECGTNLDHGVLVVGYGSLNNQPYWIVKNSWGQTWGMDGYVLIARGKNMCGIGEGASRPYYLNENIQDHIHDRHPVDPLFPIDNQKESPADSLPSADEERHSIDDENDILPIDNDEDYDMHPLPIVDEIEDEEVPCERAVYKSNCRKNSVKNCYNCFSTINDINFCSVEFYTDPKGSKSQIFEDFICFPQKTHRVASINSEEHHFETMGCGMKKFQCLLSKSCRQLVNSLKDCNEDLTCVYTLIASTQNEKFLNLVNCMYPQ
jgi:cathepsin L